MSDHLYTAVLSDLFRENEKVCILPGKNGPRLLFRDGRPAARWQRSSFYPAFSRNALLFKSAMRLASALGFCLKVRGLNQRNDLLFFLQQAGIEDAHLSVMIGTPGPTQKAIAQVRVGQQVVAYLKYGISSGARQRVRQEAAILRELPPGLAPSCLASGSLGRGEALLMEPLSGKAPSANAPVSFEFLARLIGDDVYSFAAHPWIQMMQAKRALCSEGYPELMRRIWPAAIMHGDFAPWNLIQSSEVSGQKSGGGSLIADSQMMDNGALRLYAIDWESGVREGFPFIDAAHYVIQSACNLHQRSPSQAAEESVRVLLEMDRSLNWAEAKELVRLAIQWLAFRDGLDLSAKGAREVWYKELVDNLLKAERNE